MRKAIIILVVSLISAMTFAQHEKGTYLLLKPSVNFGNAAVKTNGSKSNTKTRVGYGINVELMNALSKNVAIAIGAGFNSRGYKNVRSLYLDVPLSINFITNPKDFFFTNQQFIFGVGVYGGLALTGKYKNINNDWIAMKFGESTNDNRSRFDAGFLVNLGLADEDLGALHFSMLFGLKNEIPKDRRVDDNFLKLNTLNVSWAIPLKEITHKKK